MRDGAFIVIIAAAAALTLCPLSLSSLASDANKEDDTATLGAFFDIHRGEACDTLQRDDVLLALALNNTIALANERLQNSTGIKITAAFADTCLNSSHTLQKTVQLLKGSGPFCEVSQPQPGAMLAMTGFFDADIAISINYLLRAFCIPTFAAGSASSALDNPSQYPFFLRSGPSEYYRAYGIYDLIQAQQWFHISVVFDTSAVGQSLMNVIQVIMQYCSASDDEGLFRVPCIENAYPITLYDDEYANETIIRELEVLGRDLERQQIYVLLVLTETSTADMLLAFLRDKVQLAPGRIQLLLASTDVAATEQLEYAYAVVPSIVPFKPLTDLVAQVKLSDLREQENDTLASWLIELIEQENGCCANCFDRIQDCHETAGLQPPSNLTLLHTRLVYDAGMALAYGIQDVHDEICGDEPGFCDKMKNSYTGNFLVNTLANVEFENESNHTFRLMNRAGRPVFNIWQFQKGSWQKVVTHYNPVNGPEPSDTANEGLAIPSAAEILEDSRSCQLTCESTIPDMRSMCCWTCRACRPDQYINNSMQTCSDCPENEIGSKDAYSCVDEPSPPIFYSPTVEMCMLMTMAVVGICSSIGLGAFLYFMKDTPMVMAAVPDVLFYQVVVEIGLFLITGLTVPTGSAWICGGVWTATSVLLLLLHATYLVKAIRLARPSVYSKCLSFMQTPRRLSLIILAMLLMMQLLICLIWLLLRTPTITRLHIPRLMYVCSSSNELQSVVLLVVPISLLIATCCFQRMALQKTVVFQVRQARVGLAGSLCFGVEYVVLLPLFFMQDSPEQVRGTIFMCIPLVTGLISCLTSQAPIAYMVFFRRAQNSHEYVARLRSRNFVSGNTVYYVDVVNLAGPKTPDPNPASNFPFPALSSRPSDSSSEPTDSETPENPQ